MADFGQDVAGSSADSLGGYSGLGLGGDVDLGSMPDWAGALNAGAESEGGTDASALNSLLAGPFGQPSGPDSLGGPDAWSSARDAAQSQQQFVSDRLAQQAADQTGAAGAFAGVDEHDTFFLGGLFSDDTASAMDLGIAFEALPALTPDVAAPADSSADSAGPTGLTLGFASSEAMSGAGAGAGAPSGDGAHLDDEAAAAASAAAAVASDPASDAAGAASTAMPADASSWDAAPAPGASVRANHVLVVGKSTPTHGPGAGVWMYAPIRASPPGTGPAEHITNRAMAHFGQVPNPPATLAGKRMSEADATQVAVIQAAQRHRSGVLSTSAQFYLQAIRCKRAHVQMQAHRRALMAGMPAEGPPPPPMMALVMPMSADEAVERIAGAIKTSAAITTKRLAFATENHALAQTAGGNIRRPRQLLRLSKPARPATADATTTAGAAAADSESKSADASGSSAGDAEVIAERAALWKARGRIDSVFEAVIHLADVQVAADALRSSLQQQEQAERVRAFQQQQAAAAAAAAKQQAATTATATATATDGAASKAPTSAGKPKGYAAIAAGAADATDAAAADAMAAATATATATASVDPTAATGSAGKAAGKRPRGSTRGRKAPTGETATTAGSKSSASGAAPRQKQQPVADARTLRAFTEASAAVIERKQGLARALGLPKGTPPSAEHYADLEAMMSLPKGKRLLLRALPKLLPEDFDSALAGMAALMVHVVCSASESPEHEAADAMLSRSWAGWVSSLGPSPEAMAAGDASNVLVRLEALLAALTASHEAEILSALLSHALGQGCVEALLMRGEAERVGVAGAAAGLHAQVEAAAAEAEAAEKAGQAVPAAAAEAMAAARTRVEAWSAAVAAWSATTERMAEIVESAQTA